MQRKGTLDGRGSWVSLPDGIEEVLGWYALHIAWPVSAKRLRGGRIALAATLDLVHDHTGGDNKEDAAEGTAECHQNHNAIGVMAR